MPVQNDFLCRLKMKSIILFVLFTISFVVCEQYTDKYDNINIDEILANRRLLLPYLKCILDKGPCTAEGRELKVHIKDGMQTACAKCTDFQRQHARKVVKHVRENEKPLWVELLQKYDPKNEYQETYEKFLNAKD
uniref:Chemosensory protein n=1 Tax=Histia rhodope TaxID=1453155 RepID=A0A6M9BNG5_9NEOP|nr:chemosensory protein [Histia rhodope]